jgi:indolepyruvate ferredoxin oxidoreductase, alpha subunit
MAKTQLNLLNKTAFSEIVIGNTAIVRAMVESGVRVVTSYPGSPTPEIAEAINSIPKENRPFYFEFSTNEKVATELAFGASMNGHTSCVFFKSVGINVAADSFVQLGFYNLLGGMVVVLGDDPGANSSQNEQDNRHLAALSYIPVFEPANPKEVYSMFKEAVNIARKKQMPVIIRLTTHVCHAKQKVDFEAFNSETYKWTPIFDNKNGPYIAITTRALEMKKKARKKLLEFEEYTETSDFNYIVNNSNSEKGIITFGAPFLSLQEVLQDSITNKPDILKLGICYPIPKKLIANFLNSHKEIRILEELDDLLEKEIKTLAFERKISCEIIGKQSEDDWIGEYTPDKVHNLLQMQWPDLLPEKEKIEKNLYHAPPRPPQLCPGCGHRPVFTALAKHLNNEDITVGDIGCHTLGFLPPHNIGQIVVSMGHSVSTGSGLAIGNSQRRVVAFVGDSTFYHAAMPGVVNAVFNNHKLTLVVLPNGTTGMTGHQDHPGTGNNFNGVTESIPIKKVLEGLGVKNIRECDAYNQKKFIENIEASFLDDGFSVVIAEHPCMLKKTREDKKSGKFLGNKIEVRDNICESLMTCIQKFACPTFQISDSGKVTAHPDLCIGDGSCMQTCEARALRNKKTINKK